MGWEMPPKYAQMQLWDHLHNEVHTSFVFEGFHIFIVGGDCIRLQLILSRVCSVKLSVCLYRLQTGTVQYSKVQMYSECPSFWRPEQFIL